MNNNYLYICNTSVLDNKEVYDKAYNSLSQQRKEKVDKFKFLKDKKLSILSEVLLKEAFNSLNINSSFNYKYNKQGKPYLEDIGNIKFNISHSGEYVICLVSNDEVGCDIEEIKDINLNIANKFFYNTEYTNIFNSSNKIDTFYRYWTLKESFIKSVGLGLSLDLNSFEIVLNDSISVRQSLNNNNYYFKEIDVKGYKCSLCLLNNNEIKIININSI